MRKSTLNVDNIRPGQAAGRRVPGTPIGAASAMSSSGV